MTNQFNLPPALVMDGNLSENWRIFKQKFENFILASGLEGATDARKIAMFLNVVGDEAVEAYNSMTISDADRKIYNRVIEEFGKYCNPRKKILYLRFLFYTRNQEQDESFDHFYTDLSKLVGDGEFGDQRKSILRDRIVLGIADKHLQARLIRMRDDEVDLEKVIEFCRVAEQTKKQLQALQGDKEAQGVDEVKPGPSRRSKSEDKNVNQNRSGENSYNNSRHRSRSKNRNRHRFSENQTGNKCSKCNYVHKKKSCPAYRKACAFCGNIGHFATVCKKRISKIDSVNENDKNDVFVDSIEQSVDAVETGWFEKLKIEDSFVVFKLDSGAAVNVISDDVFRKIKLKNQKKLKTTKCCLETYGGYKISPSGVVDLVIETDERVFLEEFVVVKTNSKPILGLNTCVKLGLIKRKVDLIEKCDKANFLKTECDVFQGLGKFSKKYSLVLKPDAIPVSKPPNRIPLALVDRVKDKLNKMCEMKIIQKVEEPSDWVSKLVIVEKSNKDLRLCLDPKFINMNLVQDYFSIPTLDEVKAKLANKKFFSVLDLRDGFWQVELEEESSKICSFSTPFGCYKFNRLPFGLNVSAEVFQRYNTMSFGDLNGVVIYIDDILVTGSSKVEHDVNLNKVIERARQLNVKFNPNKFQYCVEEVKYLGHIFSIDGMKPDPDRISAIVNYERPENKKDVQRYLGMVNYVRIFIPNLSEISKPLRDLIKKDVVFVWLPVHSETMSKINKLIVNFPVLQNFDPNKSVVIQTDSSKVGIGSCLLQDSRPVCFASKSLSDTEIGYAQIEKEFLAVLFSCKKFHNYVYGKKIVVQTDHLPLISIMGKEVSQVPSPRLQRIKLKLLKYDVDLKYVPGNKMHIADAISRACASNNSNKETIRSLSQVVHTINFSDERKNEIGVETGKDSILKRLRQTILEGWPTCNSKVPDEIKFYYGKRNELFVWDDIIFYDNRVIIPHTLRKKMLNLLHESHFGISKTKARAKTVFYWPNMDKEIETVIAKCSICEKYRSSNVKEELTQYEIPDLPFQSVSCDILYYAGVDYLVLYDRYSKWLELCKLRAKDSFNIISCLKNIFSVHGIPQILVADNVPFNSFAMRGFARNWNFQIVTSSPFYSRSNGFAEKGVHISKQMLKKSKESGTDIELMILEYRNTPIIGVGYSPAELLMSRKARTKIFVKKDLLFPKVISDVKDRLIQMNEKAKANYDKNCKVKRVSFKEGDYVMYRGGTSGNEWKRAKIVEKHNTPKSWKLRNENGNVIRRNSYHLRKSYNRPSQHGNDYEDINITPSENFDNNENRPTVQDNQINNNEHANGRVDVNGNNTVSTRSGRVVRTPAYLRNNFDLS